MIVPERCNVSHPVQPDALAKTSPDATVAFFPSDHYFSDDISFMNHVDSAFHTVGTDPKSIVLLGIEPENAETSYGWIEPVQSLFGDLSKAVSRVGRFGKSQRRALPKG